MYYHYYQLKIGVYILFLLDGISKIHRKGTIQGGI